MTKYQEIEFKYAAEDVSLEDFHDFCKNLAECDYLTISGYDYFYERPDDGNTFFRYRVDNKGTELTFKRKTVDDNNYIRTEHNIEVKKSVNRDKIEALVAEFGYSYNTKLFKTAFIYQYEWYTIVYYIVSGENAQELGRFIEIELCEDYKWKSDTAAWNELVILEKLCKDIGAGPGKRIKKSLFELYRKDEK